MYSLQNLNMNPYFTPLACPMLPFHYITDFSNQEINLLELLFGAVNGANVPSKFLVQLSEISQNKWMLNSSTSFSIYFITSINLLLAFLLIYFGYKVILTINSRIHTNTQEHEGLHHSKITELNDKLNHVITLLSEEEKQDNQENLDELLSEKQLLEEAQNLNNLLKNNLLVEENWSKFIDAFEKHHHEFCVELKQNFPEITNSNFRVIVIQKLGYNNAETSKLLGLTIDAVKKSKQRLKKKIGDRYDSLEQLINA